MSESAETFVMMREAVATVFCVGCPYHPINLHSAYSKNGADQTQLEKHSFNVLGVFCSPTLKTLRRKDRILYIFLFLCFSFCLFFGAGN